LQRRLAELAADRVELPMTIAGARRMGGGAPIDVVQPHKHRHVLGVTHNATNEDAAEAVAAAKRASSAWRALPYEERAAIFLRAADLLAGPWRDTLNAATMLGQSKTAYQAEIDSACELIDFWRFNPFYAQGLYDEQPLSNGAMWNQLDYRPLEGFVYAITPFNFTAIGGNLPTSPALMGDVVIWKPAATAIVSAHYVLKLLEEAGLPPGVVNLVAGDSAMISETLLSHPELAGVHFTGSTAVFNGFWRTIGQNIDRYRGYPRIVGETGGKDFIVAHASADAEALAVAIARGGYEYQGQKCSAASRVYVPRSLWEGVRDRTTAMIADIRVGDVRDFRNFMGAVIDRKAFDKIGDYIGEARRSARIVAGGGAKGDAGYYIEPTLVETTDPGYRLLQEEIFGPVVTAYVYDDAKWEETLELVDRTSPYALTGAIFSQDRGAARQAAAALRNAAGNFYVNDKPTGAVVGQQPFGGGRASGTNDKAGSKLNLVRWVSARTIKETFAPPRDYRYPFMAEE
ncbi:MAG TPA: L-glutamate gamma-semialdehyde dehydrogenase, partial [Vicinamibacteria bacterium]|nr:L-glutamate gamma-semialdehyde dehydrogenase [Vicinamibacteria bacterium]